MVKTTAEDNPSKYKEEISLFRAKEPGSILLEDEEIVEIIKKDKSDKGSNNQEEPDSSQTKDYQKERKDWEKFYQHNFKEKVDFGNVKIPPKPQRGDWRLVFIKKGLTINQAFDKCKELFNSWKYTEDLDKAITKNSRTPKEHYAVWVKDGEEPDAEYLGKSTQDTDPEIKIGLTLLERFILELKYFEETKKHLDIRGLTFCTGSRDATGHVLGVSWRSGGSGFKMYLYDLGNSYPGCGLRRAVS